MIKQQVRLARPIHTRFLLHPATCMTLLVVGVLIAGWTLRAAADSYNVTAKVPAPPLTEGAIITSPADGTTFATSPITVSGSCPDNSYVKLFRNSSFSGSSACVSNIFSIDTALSVGANTLVAQDYNITDDAGPATPGITVTYQPPAPAPSTPVATPRVPQPSIPIPNPSMNLSSNYFFRGFLVNTDFSWILKIDGGTAPYAVRITWGDQRTTNQTIATASTFTITHKYSAPGYFPIKVYVSDAAGGTTMLQIAAFIRTPGVSGFIIQSQNPSSWFGNLLSLLGNTKWLLVAWPSYITVSLMAVSFWLGEQQTIQRAIRVQQRIPGRIRAAHRR